jgi:hypothetical protein
LETSAVAWNPSPKVAAARDVAEKFGFAKAIVVLVNDHTGKFEVVSYGKTARSCDQAKQLGADIEKAVIRHYELL